MKVVNENDVAYRVGKSGPKYLLRGPKIDFGVVKLLPGEDFPTHYHEEVEENFFILEGEIDFLVDGKTSYHAKYGDLIHILAPETHYLKNNGAVPAKAVFVKAPFLPNDKINVEK